MKNSIDAKKIFSKTLKVITSCKKLSHLDMMNNYTHFAKLQILKSKGFKKYHYCSIISNIKISKIKQIIDAERQIRIGE